MEDHHQYHLAFLQGTRHAFSMGMNFWIRTVVSVGLQQQHWRVLALSVCGGLLPQKPEFLSSGHVFWAYPLTRRCSAMVGKSKKVKTMWLYTVRWYNYIRHVWCACSICFGTIKIYHDMRHINGACLFNQIHPNRNITCTVSDRNPYLSQLVVMSHVCGMSHGTQCNLCLESYQSLKGRYCRTQWYNDSTSWIIIM